MSKILCLETTTTNCSVAIAENGEIISIREDRSAGYSHAEKLHLFIEGVLKEKNYSLNDLDAVAVSKGPGSYTGLRIGVSAAKGLCFSLEIPLIAIETLEALATQVQNISAESYIIPMLDARRMEVFTTVFTAEGERQETTSAKILEADSYRRYLDRAPVYFVGNGVEKFKEICEHANAHFIDTLPSAENMGRLAEMKYKISDTEDVAYFEPYYLKEFQISKKKK